jgi:hypothetical protein
MVADGMHSVIAKAAKPSIVPSLVARQTTELPMAGGCGCGSGGCC